MNGKRNPWTQIRLQDYEAHMSLASVFQLQALNDMMKDQLFRAEANTVMILGIAGGNGLEHVENSKFKKIYGVDINKGYLSFCMKRYPHLNGIFEPVAADLTVEDILLPKADLLIANLLIEYIGYNCFIRVVNMVCPERISCILQKNDEQGEFVSQSPYQSVFDGLQEVYHEIKAAELTARLKQVGYRMAGRLKHGLPNGKNLERFDFEKEKKNENQKSENQRFKNLDCY